MNYSRCHGCGRENTGWYYCQPCQAKIFKEKFSRWSSGNNEIDEIIQLSRLNAKNSDEIIEFVPFSEFSDIWKVGQVGIGLVHEATWCGCHFKCWNLETRAAEKSYVEKVVLKSYTIVTDLIKEVCH